MKFLSIFALAAMIFSAESFGIRRNHLDGTDGTASQTITPAPGTTDTASTDGTTPTPAPASTTTPAETETENDSSSPD